MFEQQRTIKREISLEGVGLHPGNATTITFKPAPPDSGVRFVRTDLPGNPSVVADIDHVVDISRGTSLANGDAKVYTVEHVLAAFAGTPLSAVLSLSSKYQPTTVSWLKTSMDENPNKEKVTKSNDKCLIVEFSKLFMSDIN